MHKYFSLTAFNIHYIRIPNCTLLPIIIISHRSINFEQKCRRVVSLSVDELSQKMFNELFCRRVVLIPRGWGGGGGGGGHERLSVP